MDGFEKLYGKHEPDQQAFARVANRIYNKVKIEKLQKEKINPSDAKKVAEYLEKNKKTLETDMNLEMSSILSDGQYFSVAISQLQKDVMEIHSAYQTKKSTTNVL